MSDQIFHDILAMQGYLVMERLGNGRFRLAGSIPEWFTNIFDPDMTRVGEFSPETMSPFVENFFPLAEQFWREKASKILRSGPWTESDPSGQDYHFEMSALNIGHRKILLLQVLGEEFEEKQDILQRCREQGLDYEILHRTQKALKAAHELVLEKQRQLSEDMEAAAEIQRRFLPREAPRIKGLAIASKFQPSLLIAGDMFDVIPLDETHLGIYILDVSGHGASAAMLAVSVCQMMQPNSGILMKKKSGGSRLGSICPPSEVLQALDLEFPIERFDKYFTMVYGVLNCRDGELTYSNAGHPQPILLHLDGTMKLLEKGGTIVGLGGIIPYEEERISLHRGDKIILYSDGVTELQNPQGNLFGMERFTHLVQKAAKQSIKDALETIHSSLMEFAGHHGPQDDLSLLGMEIDLP